MRRILIMLAGLAVCAPAAAQLEGITNTEAVRGLKQALSDGSVAAVAALGVENGFFGNAKVKIPLPPSLQRIEGALRFAGMQREADELVLSMNRAAEAAVTEAKPLLLDAIGKMSVQDAKAILTGGDTAATDYLARTTREPLRQRFAPIVSEKMDEVGLARLYDDLAARYENRDELRYSLRSVSQFADFVDHIDYLVDKIGIEHVGISSDFDGGGGVEGGFLGRSVRS